jgi:RNA polymerase sigma-70 factor (ECF subfamily)
VPNKNSPEQLVELLAACARKDEQAFAQLYRASAPKLFAVAIRILRRRDWAEEVLQDSFVSIWNHAADYTQGKSAPMTWMTSIVRNRSLDLLRRPAVETPSDLEAIMEVRMDTNPGPFEQALAAADASNLARCLKTLEPRQRQSIVLAFFHGLTHSELAVHLQQPLGSVKTWIRRGLQQLKACLGNSV